MKKILTLICASLIVLSGCKDAYTKVSNPNEVILSIGNSSVTKNELYKTLLNNYATYYVINDASNAILDIEVETSDEMKEKASKRVEDMKVASQLQGGFDVVLNVNGFENEEELLNALINIEKSTELTKKYIDANFDTLVEKYNPKLCVVLSFSNVDDANLALEELKNGTDANEVATAYNSSTIGTPIIVTSESNFDSSVMTTLNTATIDQGFVLVESSDKASVNLVKVIQDNPSEIKEDIIEEFVNIDQINKDTETYFFKKHNFKIFDKDVFDAIQKSYPEYITE